MRPSLIRTGAMFVFAASAGCNAATDPTPAGDAVMEAQGEVDRADSVDRFVTLTPDLRRCAAPICGGYFVHAVNLDLPASHVSKLVFEDGRFSEATISTVREARTNDVVLLGHLGPADTTFHTRSFIVRGAYRGLPGATLGAADAFYAIEKRVPPVVCVTTPCPNHVAVKLNTKESVDIDDVSLDQLSQTYLDTNWLHAEALYRDAVVIGQLTPPTNTPGTQRLLMVSQIDLQLPVDTTPCPVVSTPDCGGLVATFQRDSNRCLLFKRCVDTGLCPRLVPQCDDGYVLQSWNAEPSGCRAFACDPIFAAR